MKKPGVYTRGKTLPFPEKVTEKKLEKNTVILYLLGYEKNTTLKSHG